MKGIPYAIALSYGRQLWRHKWLSLALVWPICVGGWLMVALLTPKYESSTRVYVNADQLLTPILNGVAVTEDPTREVEYLQRTLLSRPNLEQVIHLSDVDLSAGAGSTAAGQESSLEGLARDVIIKAQTANLFTIAYRNRDPVMAKNVVSAFLTVFSENVAGNNRNDVDNAKHFLNQEIDSYQTQLRAADKRRAEFHQKYLDLLPGLDGAVSNLDAGRAAIDKLQLQIADAEAKRDSLQHELEGIPKFLSIDAAGPQVIVAGRPVDARTELADSISKLEDLQTRFTDQYPDVIYLKQRIAALQARVANEKAHPDVGGTKTDIANPVYEQIKVKLVDVETTLASLGRALKQAQDVQVGLERKALDTPGVLAQAQDLDRDYQAKKASYDQLIQRREQTLIGEAADTSAQKIQFRVIDAPQVPIAPAAPNKPLLYLGVLVLALGAGVVVPLGLMQLDKSFSTVGALRELGLPVLGSVSRVTFPGARRRTRMQVTAVCASASALVAIFGVLLVLSINVYGLGFGL